MRNPFRLEFLFGAGALALIPLLKSAKPAEGEEINYPTTLTYP